MKPINPNTECIIDPWSGKLNNRLIRKKKSIQVYNHVYIHHYAYAKYNHTNRGRMLSKGKPVTYVMLIKGKYNHTKDMSCLIQQLPEPNMQIFSANIYTY